MIPGYQILECVLVAANLRLDDTRHKIERAFALKRIVISGRTWAISLKLTFYHHLCNDPGNCLNNFLCDHICLILWWIKPWKKRFLLRCRLFPFHILNLFCWTNRNSSTRICQEIWVSLFSFTYHKTTSDIWFVLLGAKVETLGWHVHFFLKSCDRFRFLDFEHFISAVHTVGLH